MGLSGARPQARRAAGGFASGLRSTGRAGASTARGTGRVIRRLTQASGAARTGLDRVIELTAAGAAADAFVAVALAGTLFFSTSVDQARCCSFCIRLVIRSETAAEMALSLSVES